MDIYCVEQIVVDVLVKPVNSVNFNTDTKRVENICFNIERDCSNCVIALSKFGNFKYSKV